MTSFAIPRTFVSGCERRICDIASQTSDNHAGTSTLDFFTDRMVFLTPSQQCQSAEGSISSTVLLSFRAHHCIVMFRSSAFRALRLRTIDEPSPPQGPVRVSLSGDFLTISTRVTLIRRVVLSQACSFTPSTSLWRKKILVEPTCRRR